MIRQSKKLMKKKVSSVETSKKKTIVGTTSIYDLGTEERYINIGLEEEFDVYETGNNPTYEPNPNPNPMPDIVNSKKGKKVFVTRNQVKNCNGQ